MNKNSNKNSWKRMSNFIWLTPSRRCKRRSCWTISCRPCQLLLAGTYKVRKIPKKECRFKEVFQILNAKFFEKFSNGMALHWEWRKTKDHFFTIFSQFLEQSGLYQLTLFKRIAYNISTFITPRDSHIKISWIFCFIF